jgi:hypothetical protein
MNVGMDETGRFADVDLSGVEGRDDVAALVSLMVADLRAYPDSWENPTLDRFLEALAASLGDAGSGDYDGGIQRPVQPTWRLFAELLVMASGYE